MKNNTPTLLLLLTLCLPGLLSAQQQNGDMQKQINDLRTRIAALEARVAQQETIIRSMRLIEPPTSRLATSVTVQPSAPAAQNQSGTIVGGVKTTGMSVLDRLRSGITYTKLPATGKWTELANWKSLNKGMGATDVMKILGNPLFTKDSIRPRADEYWQYAGRLANGEQLAGRVRFYKGKLTTWDEPKF